jgi:nucleotide-binding universal stress UspA family protein
MDAPTPKPYKTVAIAVAFSPTMEALLAEAVRIRNLFDAKIILIHVGEKTEEKEININRLAEYHNLHNVIIVWKKGNTVEKILEACDTFKVDLLIAGALVKDNIFTYYMGSIARDIIRQAKCNVLLLQKPSIRPASFKKIVLNLSESDKTHSFFEQAFEFLRHEKVEKLFVTRECELHGFKRMINNDLPEGESYKLQKEMVMEDQSVFEYANSRLRYRQIPYITKMLSGKPGVEISTFTKEQEADLLIIEGPSKKYGLIDRIFPHDMEHIMADLPTNILMLKS